MIGCATVDTSREVQTVFAVKRVVTEAVPTTAVELVAITARTPSGAEPTFTSRVTNNELTKMMIPATIPIM